ncbi:hypothetical protein EIP91_003509 [Steccherinum ochraceum]|uniref:Uncharacterized protein n=1 Tax=Steccherinum ochraceum TaxID=92696 RepID=A0A4R0S0A5_9APHY|nr:hypothetical protein EIP91_003509 [Steccherinum ochraceum]
MRSPSSSPQTPSPSTTSHTPLAGPFRPRKKNRHTSPSVPAVSEGEPRPLASPPSSEGSLRPVPPFAEESAATLTLANRIAGLLDATLAALAELHTIRPDFQFSQSTTELLDKVALLRAPPPPPSSPPPPPVRETSPQSQPVQVAASESKDSSPNGEADLDNPRAKGNTRRIIVRTAFPVKGVSLWKDDQSVSELTSKINADYEAAYQANTGRAIPHPPISGAYFSRRRTLILITHPLVLAANIVCTHVHRVVTGTLQPFASAPLHLETDVGWHEVVIHGQPKVAGLAEGIGKWEKENPWLAKEYDSMWRRVTRFTWLAPAGREVPEYCALRLSLNHPDIYHQLIKTGLVCNGVHCKVTPYRRRTRPKPARPA